MASQRRSHQGIAGAIAAVTALGVAESLSSLDATSPTIVEAAGLTFIDQFAATLKDVAVAIFGTHHKTALIIGTWVVIIGLAAFASRSTTKSRRNFTLLVAVIGVVGLSAFLTRPLSNAPLGVIAITTGLATGLTLHRYLLHVAMPVTTDEVPSFERPGEALGNRRQFMVVACTAVAGAAGATAIATTVRRRSLNTEPAVTAPLPTPSTSIPPIENTLDGIDGITPFITPNSDFYRIDTALVIPKVDPATWSLTIDGMVNRPQVLTYDDLIEASTEVETVTIACVSNEVGGNLVGNATWQGVRLADVLDRAGIQQGASQIVGHSVDGFTAGMPTATALDGRVALIATAMNGTPLPQRHGFPARLIVSGLYGYVSATKWLSRIELTTWEATEGYWIPRGWSKEAPVKLTSRIDVPQRSSISAGVTPIAGIALSPSIGISRVEVSINDGPWQSAELGDHSNDNTWVQWHLPWESTTGDHIIRVRAIDSDGNVQDETPRAVAPDGATGFHRRRVTVR
ncbi:MAG: molybdopterin-dependent oxidoreductase [Ilumatobacteraceae bacterium]